MCPTHRRTIRRNSSRAHSNCPFLNSPSLSGNPRERVERPKTHGQSSLPSQKTCCRKRATLVNAKFRVITLFAALSVVHRLFDSYFLGKTQKELSQDIEPPIGSSGSRAFRRPPELFCRKRHDPFASLLYRQHSALGTTCDRNNCSG